MVNNPTRPQRKRAQRPLLRWHCAALHYFEALWDNFPDHLLLMALRRFTKYLNNVEHWTYHLLEATHEKFLNIKEHGQHDLAS